jgi:hypothetical protein
MQHDTSPSHRVDQAVCTAIEENCVMLSQSSSMAVRSCWLWAGTGTRCRIHRSRPSQAFSLGDVSGEYAGHGRTWTFSVSRYCVQILATRGSALSWWWWRMNATRMGLRIASRYLCAFKLSSIKCNLFFQWNIEPSLNIAVTLHNLQCYVIIMYNSVKLITIFVRKKWSSHSSQRARQPKLLHIAWLLAHNARKVTIFLVKRNSG